MQTAATCDLCANPPPFMCNECAGRDMSDEGREVIAAMNGTAPTIHKVHVERVTRRSIIGATVPADFLYV